MQKYQTNQTPERKGNEIQESMSRAYDLPEEVDEGELDAELEALGEESMFESEVGESAMHEKRTVIRGSFCFSIEVMKAKQWSLGMALIGLDCSI